MKNNLFSRGTACFLLTYCGSHEKNSSRNFRRNPSNCPHSVQVFKRRRSWFRFLLKFWTTHLRSKLIDNHAGQFTFQPHFRDFCNRCSYPSEFLDVRQVHLDVRQVPLQKLHEEKKPLTAWSVNMQICTWHAALEIVARPCSTLQLTHIN
jgi:hypothetical protein